MINFSGVASSSSLGKIARLPLKWVPENLVVPVMQGRLKGKLWLTGSHTHGCWLGSYERDKQILFERLTEPGAVVFDIGANVGFYTLLAATKVGRNGHVYAFEPLPRNLNYLRRHIALNKLTNVTVVDCAVSDRAGMSKFNCTTSATSALSTEGELMVKTVALDDSTLSELRHRPTLLKIDVEGAELSVLRGAENLIRICRPRILLATHGEETHRQCCEFLSGSGYKIQSVDGRPLDETDELLATP